MLTVVVFIQVRFGSVVKVLQITIFALFYEIKNGIIRWIFEMKEEIACLLSKSTENIDQMKFEMCMLFSGAGSRAIAGVGNSLVSNEVAERNRQKC